ncbi:recombination regulator RecX [Niallia circulans]|jgi:regulatory protein|uniref:recombination regulator RecX n=1 Tax=Niallia circulans TaxID=1397 RepID=UPI0014905ADD|nr:recombination regulator RecX [Niallia circulans]QJX60993.1 recombination regulator RecX [Niallia circulans]
MIISKITRQKELNDRYNIFTLKQGKDVYAFSVDETVLIKYKLRKGMELDSLLLNEIQYTDEIRKGYHMAVRYLSKVKRTEMEVRKHLSAKMENDALIAEVMTKLKEMKFIDDEDYAFSYVRTQRNTTTKGAETIKRELREKGIQRELIERSMEELSYEDQMQAAKKIVAKSLAGKKKDSKKIIIQKLEQTLVRKGYTSDIIQQVKRMPEIVEMDTDELETVRIHGEKARRKFSKFTGYEFKQKMKQFLYRKGFSMDLIEQYLDEIENED